MNPRPIQTLALAAICSISLLAAPSAKAQSGVPDSPENLQLGELVTHSITLMQYKQWKKALEFCDQAIKDEGDGALEQWGPLFGTIYYRKGICEMKLEKHGAAAASFEKCYKDFPNKPQAQNKNEFEKRALFQWAKAEMGQEEWQKALDLFQKFLNEREHPRDSFSQGDFFVSRALCYYKLRQVVPGNQSFESALQNRLAYRVPTAAILNCFREMVEAAMEKQNEQAIVDFIKKNRGSIIAEDHEMYPFSGVILKLAGEALKADMKRASILLYQLMPCTEAAIEQSQKITQDIGKLPGVMSKVSGAKYAKEEMEKRVKRLQEEMDSPKSIEISQLTAIAFMYEKQGNVRGAYAAYRQLEDYFPHAERREDNLYHLARTAFMVDGGANALPDAKKFLAEYPDSKHAPSIKRLMFASLFAEQRYEECVESASEMIGQLTPGTKDHDICLHVFGGSHFYLGNYETAKPLLQQHIEQYPDSDSKVAAAYFNAANYYRMQEIDKAGELLSAFIEKYPSAESNPFLPFALLDRATVHYMNEENKEAVQLASRLIDNFKDHSVEDQAFNLRGNAYLAMEENREAQDDYVVALEVAQRWDHDVVAAEALFSLADLAVSEGEAMKGDEGSARIKEAMPYIKNFWENYGMDSPLRRQMAVMQLPVFMEFDRLDEALERLRAIIKELAAADDVMAMEKTIPHYTEAYMEAYSAEQLRDHYRAFEGISLDMKAARAILAVEVIRVFEKVAKKAEGEDAKMAAQATVKNLFADLKNQFDLKDLASSILINVGDYLRMNTSAPREALPFYSQVLERKDEQYRLDALNGRGAIFALSPLPGDLEKGLEDFRAVAAETEDKGLKEEALFNIIKILMSKKDHAAADTQARDFLLKKNGFTTTRKAMVMLMLGESQQARGMQDDAITSYGLVFTNPTYMGIIEASAPSIINWMKILWMRNKPGDAQTMSDRQGAYEAGMQFLQFTGRFKDKMRAADLELWLEVEALVKQYEANPAVTPKKVGEEDK